MKKYYELIKESADSLLERGINILRLGTKGGPADKRLNQMMKSDVKKNMSKGNPPSSEKEKRALEKNYKQAFVKKNATAK